MNIRRKTEIAVPIIISLIFALYLFPYLLSFLPMQMKELFCEKILLLKSTSGYHTYVIRISFWTIFISGLFDAIVKRKKWLKILSSQYALLFVGLTLLLLLFFPMNSYWLLVSFYAISFIGLLMAFNQIVINNGFSKGMFNFIKELKNGIGKSDNLVDTIVIFIVSITCELLLFLQLISAMLLLIFNYHQFF